ncbi:hypothetical protein H257_01901 [Aphanomyces astaci]|uniref:Uncharacterized protein n=1 Tax=Aphanomyces astaci TaxID=112090 RepID=W4H5H1_APHAT|nr:hypothetical protein H257_01901 [Aphanomyces astaci]ETV86846.1 hypothetical protein H257_01901 [Aphanomyces astaci]|eukprot:XP_009823645.1 hypothetical protein H257_01901 [Aphanomyces astaci]
MRKAIVIAFLRRWLIRRRLAKELFAKTDGVPLPHLRPQDTKVDVHPPWTAKTASMTLASGHLREENKGLTDFNNEAIDDYKQQWEATPQVLLLELAPSLRCLYPC